jgi:hypothetical protein
LLSVVTAIHEKDTQREEELKTLRERVDSHEDKIRSQNDYIDSLNEITAKPFVQNICVQNKALLKLSKLPYQVTIHRC